MATINQLTAVDAVSTGDQLPIYDASNGDARKASMAVIQTYMQDSLTFFDGRDAFISQYASPGNGATVQVTDADDSIHLILTPAGTIATAIIKLPAVLNLVDKQEVLVNTTQQITSLTINGNGATDVIGEPTSLSADDFFRLKYDLLNLTWYRVG